MKLSTTIIFLFLFFVIKSQTVTSTCNAPSNIIKKYKKDADILAVRYSIKANSTYKDSGVIDNVLSQRYLKALIAVYNATTLPARDTVVSHYNIHRPYLEELNKLDVAADSTLPWMINMKNGVFPSGYIEFDNLILKYYLQVYAMFPIIGGKKAMSFKTDTNCNIPEVAKQFSVLSGVDSYYSPFVPQACPFCPLSMGLPEFISDSVNVNFIQLTYTYGWNDCPSGCGNQRNWIFKVYNDCTVEYVGSNGNPLPFVGNHENELKSNLKIFPNPVDDKLTVKFNGPGYELRDLSFYNLFGEKIYEIKIDKLNTEIDISFLPSGIYFINIQGDMEKQKFKLIKQ